jgi:hypothetical protein
MHQFRVFLAQQRWNKIYHKLSDSQVTLVWFMVFKDHFHQYFSYIVEVNSIGGGKWSTRRKEPTCRKSLTNFIT